jgi:hypothetical protein
MDYLAILKRLDSGKADAGNMKAAVAGPPNELNELNEERSLQQAEPTQCGPECYEIEPGRRIHRPWTGKCRAKIQVAEPRHLERQCWHCHGSTRCACISCCEGLPAGSEATCMTCNGTGKALVWVH